MRNDFSNNLNELHNELGIVKKGNLNKDHLNEILKNYADIEFVKKFYQSNQELKDNLKRNYEDENIQPKEIIKNENTNTNTDELKNVQEKLIEISKELAGKLNIRDLCRMVDYKANIK